MTMRAPTTARPRTLLAVGCGYVAEALARVWIAEGGRAVGTTRDAGRAGGLRAAGIEAVEWRGGPAGAVMALAGPPEDAALLVSAPPDEAGCPVHRAMGGEAWAWAGYLSTTGVYGDLGGGWAFEETPVNPQSPEAARRAAAEADWLKAGAHVFRLPGIYGPGRSALERALAPDARRIVKPGQVFSRAHRDDIAAALLASVGRPHRGRVYNICDDEPAGADVVLAFAAELLGRPPPPEVDFEAAGLTEMGRRFYAECKRVSNARAKAELGWRPAYPTYREGLRACLAG